MKQITRPRLVTIVLSGLIFLGVQAAQATTSINNACPEKYIATVTNVEDIESSSALPKVEVDFQIIQTLKGQNVLSKKIQFVNNGPVIYTLEANDIWLCSATVFSKI